MTEVPPPKRSHMKYPGGKGAEPKRTLDPDPVLPIEYTVNAEGETVLDMKLVVAFGELLREGNTLANAARVCGVRATAIKAWTIKGNGDLDLGQSKTVEAAFVREVEKALGEQERRLVNAAMAAAERDLSGRTALDMLGRRNPKAWGPSLPDAEDLAKHYESMTEEQLRKELAAQLGQPSPPVPAAVPPTAPEPAAEAPLADDGLPDAETP